MRSGEAEFVGRAELLREARELSEGNERVTVLCVHGPTEIGKSRAIERIVENAEERKALTAFVDLEESRAPQEVAKAIRTELKARLRWRPMTRTAMLEQQLAAEALPGDVHETLSETGMGAVRTGIGAAASGPLGAAGGALSLFKPVARLAKRPLRWVGRPRQSQWVRRHLAGLPRGDARFERRSRRSRIQALIAPAIAADVAELVHRRSSPHAVLAMDHHQRSGQLLEPGQNEDFALALARHLLALDARVTLVLGRDAPLEERALRSLSLSADPNGAVQPVRLVQRPLGPLSTEELCSMLGDLQVAEPLATQLADLCLGHPGIAIRSARENLSPVAGGSFSPEDEASVQQQLASILDQLLDRRSEEGRRLLRLAALPRAFDGKLLAAMANGPVVPGWISDEVRRGMVEQLDDGTRPVWRVERVWRGLLLRGLAGDADRTFVEEGNRRARDYLKALPTPEDPDAQFSRTVELLYHELALDPRRNFSRLVAAADAQLEAYRTDHCQELLAAAEDMHSFDHGLRTQAILLRAKLYGDLNQYAAALGVLEGAEREHPLDQEFDWASVAVALELTKVERLSGAYDSALGRISRIAESAAGAGNVAVEAHCSWERSLILKQFDEIEESDAELTLARSKIEALLSNDGAAAEREARLFGISSLSLKPAHMHRHEAELRRIRGDYRGAHRSVEQAEALYGDRHDRAAAHGEVVRAHVLRMEGFAEEAATAAARIVELCHEEVRDERLRPYALRAEVLARIALGEEPSEQIEGLIATDTSLYPAGKPSGHLARAELLRRHGELAQALGCYEQAREAAERSRGQAERCSATIGMLECLRADRYCGNLQPETLLGELLAHPCLPTIPWVALRAELQRAMWRKPEQGAALARAREIAAAFVRRPEDRRLDESLLSDVTAALDNGTSPDSIPLEHL